MTYEIKIPKHITLTKRVRIYMRNLITDIWKKWGDHAMLFLQRNLLGI